jgi:D-xylose transport system ATP-binding protein
MTPIDGRPSHRHRCSPADVEDRALSRWPAGHPNGPGVPLVEMRDICVSFGGVRAVDGVTIDLFPGEVVGLLGHNGAGKSTLIKVLSGACQAVAGDILIDGERAEIRSPRDARRYNVETIYQTLALADNLNAAQNLFLGRELVTAAGFIDDRAMAAETHRVMARLNPSFAAFTAPVRTLSGGQRQSVAIARAVHFDAKILIMDEPTAALGVAETRMVAALIEQLKAEGLGIFLISHDIHDALALCDRVSVLKNGRLVGTVRVEEVTEEDILGMIILGKPPSTTVQ